MSDFELRTTLRDWDERTFGDRLGRFKFLASIDEDSTPIPALDGLAPHYKQEAGGCYVQGNFVASIIMVGVTIDAFLRSIFRSKYHANDYVLKSGRHLDDFDCSQIIDEALAEGYITTDECKALHHIRKDICEPYTQIKANLISDPSIPLKSYDLNSEELRSESEEERVNKNIKDKKAGIPSYDLQEFKITDPWLVGKSAEKEARQALYLLAKLLPNILQRHT